jgi:hypothetical protein
MAIATQLNAEQKFAMESLFYLGLDLVLTLFALNLYLAIQEEKRR